MIGRWPRLLAVLLALPASLIAADGPRMLLAGGALPVCAGASPEACVDGAIPAPPQAPRLRLDAGALARVASGWWHPHRRPQQAAVLAGLRQWLARIGERDLRTEELGPELGAAWAPLAEFERQRVLDALEVAAGAESVSLADSRADSGATIYRAFVAMAREVSGRAQPRVLVSTASSRDPYNAIAFYQEVFTQAGAQVRWLPLDQALRAAQRDPARDCARLDALRGERWGAQDRAHLHPERAQALEAACRDPRRLRAALDWADALFLNGGDQSFTRAAWFTADGQPSPELRQLRARLAAGSLVLGGTSAGTAVQAAADGPMLVSGSALPRGAARAGTGLPPDPSCAAADACSGVDPDALLVHPGGGLGSFWGVLDTHFSERGREYRLARVLLDTPAVLGVGVDENTALRLDRVGTGWRAQAIGQGGVTWLREIAPGRLAWHHHRAGDAPAWPPPKVSPRCATAPAPRRTLAAGGPALRDALLSLAPGRSLELTLLDGDREVPAGRACADGHGQAVWQLPLSTQAESSIQPVRSEP